MPSGLTFRPCDFADFDMMLDFVGRVSKKDGTLGWYDQYAKLAGTMNIRDVVLGFEGGNIIAAALTYSKGTGSPAAEDLPWANTIGDNVGGVTCIGVSSECDIIE
jgi:hypothetical protein